MLTLNIKHKNIVRFAIAMMVFLPAVIFAGTKIAEHGEASAITATIIFHSNGGHGSPDAKTCTADGESCSMTLPEEIPTRDGYLFLGWGMERHAWPEFQPGQVIWLDSSVDDLYAIWTPIKTLTLDVNGGEGEYEPLSCYFNPLLEDEGENPDVQITTKNVRPDEGPTMPPCHVMIPENEPTRDGYVFIGWSEEKYPENFFDGVIQQQSDAMKNSFWDDYFFRDWFYAGGSSYFMSDEPYMDTNLMKLDYTLYAVWFPTYNLTFDLNGGEGEIPSQGCSILDVRKESWSEGGPVEVYYEIYGTKESCDVRIPRATPTREGYSFLGWAENKTADEPEYYQSSVVTIDSDKTLYALWSPVFTLSYDLNGGYGDIAPRVCEFDISGGTSCEVEVTNARPVRDDYFFLGWADYAEAGDGRYQAGELITLTGSKVLYAVWAPIYTLRFDANGGLASSEVLSCHSFTTVSAPCDVIIPNFVPIREGYDFVGWAESDTATAARYYPGDTVTLGGGNTALLRRILLLNTRATDTTEPGSKVLYAVWEEKMPVPDAGGDDDPTPTPTPTPTPKPDDTPSKPDTGRMTEENNHSNIINTIAIFILVPSILALGGYTVKRYNDKKKMFFDNNR